MDHSTGKHQWESCEEQFIDFKQFFSYKHRNHEEPQLQAKVNSDDENTSQNTSNNFKTSFEMQIGKTFLELENEDNKRTDSSFVVFNETLDFSDRKINQFHPEINKSTAVSSFSKNVTGCSEEPHIRYHLIPEDSTNEPCLSLKYSENEMRSLEMNFQVNGNRPSIYSVYNEFGLYGMNEQHNRNQLFSTEYTQTQPFYVENRQQLNVSVPSTSTGITRVSEHFPQINTTHLKESFEYSPIESSVYEMNQQFDAYKPTENREMEFTTHGINLQAGRNQRAVIGSHDNSLSKNVLSSSTMAVNKIDLHFEKYSKNNSRKLDSVGTSTTVYGGTKYTNTQYLEKSSDMSCLTQNEFDMQCKTGELNFSPEKGMKFYSTERLKKHESARGHFTTLKKLMRFKSVIMVNIHMDVDRVKKYLGIIQILQNIFVRVTEKIATMVLNWRIDSTKNRIS
ncbi:hypothetical protein TNCT_380891 [Trichonephila clavata]|uniref:Uncharacterized protein n=1 Tax=Trichonephila clavata TaxID=2740835 RepID=A0A8X6LUT1_TRICU|nr:hypothetical protein TNCT_380891 [Trichonephila clavata]